MVRITDRRAGGVPEGGVRQGIGRIFFAVFFVAITAGNARSELPFITDDAETLGKGTSQVELWYLGSTDKETVDGASVKANMNLPGATFGYGVTDRLDLTLGLARVWGNVSVNGVPSSEPGNALFTLNAKWRFHEDERSGFHLALKPLVGYSYVVGGTGDDHTVSLGGWLVATKESEPLSVSLDVGYLFNEYGSTADRDASRSSLWSASALAEYEVTEGLELGVDVGASTNQDKTESKIPVYALAGVVCTPEKNIDLSLGVKFGITGPEPDLAGIAGVTIRF